MISYPIYVTTSEPGFDYWLVTAINHHFEPHHHLEVNIFCVELFLDPHHGQVVRAPTYNWYLEGHPS